MADLLDELLDLATRIAGEAGLMLLQRPDDLEVRTKSTPTDVVTVMDRRAERLLVDRIRAERPDDGFLGEEGASAQGTSGVRWVLDPVDGTVNYLYGLPGWSVSVGVEVESVVQVAVVEVPTYRETFTAVRGRGAWRDGVRIRASGCARLDEAMVSTGFGYDASRRTRQAQIVGTILPTVRDIRRLGAASVDLCFVGCGRVDAYFERGLQPWDLAAGGLVAAEAGAVVGGLNGAPASGTLVIAAGPQLFGPLHDLIAPLRPDED